MYYLQSRYYDPEIGRFINADEYTSTGQGLLGHNMFAYCLNNPINMEDSQGNIANTIIGGLVGGLIGGITSTMQGESFWSGAAQGMVSGAIAGASIDLIFATGGLGIVAAGAIAFAGGFFGSLAGEQAHSLVTDKKLKKVTIRDVKEAAISGTINVVSFGYSKLVSNALGSSFKPAEYVASAFASTHFSFWDTICKASTETRRLRQ